LRIPDLDLDLVRCFLTVVESGGFTRAAQRLHLTQSAVSLKIQRFEALLDRPVFIRPSRDVQLTPEGEVVLGYARRLLALNREMIESVAQPGIGAPLRLGVAQQLGQQLLPELLALFKREHPQVRLSAEVGVSGSLLKQLEDDLFDVVVATAGVKFGDREKACREESILFREPLIWVQAKASKIDPRKDPLPLVVFAEPCGFRRSAVDQLDRAGRAWQIVYSSTSLGSIQAAVQADLGVSLVGRSALVPGMKPIPHRAGLPLLPETALAIYTRPSPGHPMTPALTEFIARAVRRQRAGKARKPTMASLRRS